MIFLQGALVGGPNDKDEYDDSRENYQQSEVALDYNAGFQGLMAALFHHSIIKGPNKIYSAIPPEKLQSKLMKQSVLNSAPNDRKQSLTILFSSTLMLYLCNA